MPRFLPQEPAKLASCASSARWRNSLKRTTLGLTNKKGRKLRPLLFGGDEEDRTPDLRIANATLSQLSYVPVVLWRSGSRQAP